MKRLTAIVLVLALAFALSSTALAAGGSTTISVTVDSSQISVSVPLSLSITAKVDGGEATVPNDYKIANNSAIPVKVDTIAVTLNNSTGWAFKGTAIEAGTEPTTDGINDIFLSVNGQVLAVQTARAPASLDAWNIDANNELALPLVCSTSKLDQTTDESGLITITYVISAGTHVT